MIRNEASCAGYRGLQFTAEEAAAVCCTKPTVADFAAAIPRLEADVAIVRAGGDVGPAPDPAYRWYEFSPEIVGDHLVVSKTAKCHCHWDTLDCEYSETGGVFDVNPAEYFSLGPGVERGQAFEIARLFRGAKIQPEDWFRPWDEPGRLRVEGVVPGAFGEEPALFLYLSSPACLFDLPVRVEGDGEDRHLRALAPMDGACA